MKTIKETIILRKQKKNHGFTLVELIVVLTILAILAALIIPALIGYIDKSKKQAAIAEAKEVADRSTGSYVGMLRNVSGKFRRIM